MTPEETSTGVDRRTFLMMGGALAAAPAGATQHTEARPPTSLPAEWERAEVTRLWPGAPPGGEHFARQNLPADWPVEFIRNVAEPNLHVFKPTNANGRSVLIIPGGAYQFVSSKGEGLEVAERLNAVGVTAFVLAYRLPNEGWIPRASVPLQDAQRAMRLIRQRAKSFGIDADSLAVVGFSAGGHLAGSLTTLYAESVYTPVDRADELSARPFAAALIYPVLSMKPGFTHGLSRDLLLGPDPTQALVEARSVELHVDSNTPPVFMVHALDDGVVPPENTLNMLSAMRAARRPVEAHLFQEGGHGFGIGHPGLPAAQWPELYWTWLQRTLVAANA